MIRVNLLSNGPGAQAPRVWVPREQRSALIGLGLLLATASTVGGWWWYLSSARAETETRITQSETKIEELKDALKLLDAARAQKAELEERLALIDRLRVAKHAPVRMLDLINAAVPQGLWLLEIKQVGTTVQIEGRALSLTSVTDFTGVLQGNGFFKMPVEIITTSTEQVEDATVVRFVLRAEPIAPTGTVVVGAAPTSVAGRPGA